jgi:hypothetical protein
MTKPDYAKHYEVLMAVVTHLGVNKWALRQPRGIANDLSIDEESIRTVLKSFKGLFRQSAKTSGDHGDHFYSLHLRHSRQPSGENPQVERGPLDAEYLFPLLKFISEKSAQQSQQATALRLAALSSLISLLVACVSLYITLRK